LQAVYWRKQLGALTAQAEAFRIDTEGKRSDELLNMVREQRNNPARLRSQARGDRNAATHEKASQ
jgi:hypothetical protein